MEDNKIIELYLDRNESAIAATSEKYGAYLNRTAFNILRCNEDAEECVSDTYLKCWNAIPPQRPNNLKAFLAKIARNSALDIYEKQNAEKRGNGQIAACLDELSEIVPTKEMEQNELTEIINEFLKKQNAKDRQIFIRRYWFMDSIRDTAINCFCSESKVKTTLFRMRENLKAELSKEGIQI